MRSTFKKSMLIGGILLAFAGTSGMSQADSNWQINLGSLMQHYSFSTDSNGLNVKIDGKFDFNVAEDDFESVSDKAVISQVLGGKSLRLTIVAGKKGMERSYTVDGKEQVFDAQAKTWLATVINTLILETGLHLEEHVQNLYKRGGQDALALEIDRLRGDYARRVYVQSWLKVGSIDAAHMGRVLSNVAKGGSDYEKRLSYISLLKSRSLETASMVALLDGVTSMHSDYEKRLVLADAASLLGQDAAVASSWGSAVRSINSAYEARLALVALAQTSNASPAQLQAAIEAAGRLNSAYESRIALTELSNRVGNSPELARASAAAASRISSAYEKRIALTYLVDHATLDASGYQAVLAASKDISSDYETRIVLVEIANRMPKDNALIEQYKKIAEHLGDHERRQAEQALARFAS